MSGSTACCKYLLFFFNLLIFLGGVVMLGTGIWVLVGSNSFREIVSSNPAIFHAVYIIIAVGVLLFLVGFLGCCGAIKENKCLLGMFFFFVLIIFLAEIVGGILAFVNYPVAKDVALETMTVYGNLTSKTGNSITAAWNALQGTFSCCGLNGRADWVNAGVDPTIYHENCKTTPPSKGCEEALKNYFTILGGIALGVLFVELLSMIFACCIYRNVEEKRY
ncbi:tetraspanin-18-like [Clavelina lepadiformis]|uniref:Tetraspanin n=1 Tax=Clavelina lepadiformis TaxID=159417 RepID=A0ABP0EXJ6_CLALP